MENQKDFIRMNTVKRIDPHVTSIIDSAVSTALYKYEEEGENWRKTDVEGTLMLYKREAPPNYMLTIINRLNKTNFLDPVNKSIEMQMKEPYLLIKNSNSIYCIWFPVQEDSQRIYDSIMSIIDNDPKPQTQSTIFNDPAVAVAGDDILSMLSRAQGEFDFKRYDKGYVDELLKPSPLRAEGNPNLIENLFAKASNVNSGPTPMNAPINHQIPSNPSPNPVLQKLFQYPAVVGAHTFKSTPPQPIPTVPIPIPGSSLLTSSCPISSIGQNTPMSLQELEGRLKEHLHVNEVKEETSTALLSPQVFSASVGVNKSLASILNSSCSQVNGGRDLIQHETLETRNMGITPLTQEQLAQAFTILLKKKDFVAQLHQAYIESIHQSLG